MNIVAVLESYRKDGVNDRMTRAVAQGARESGANVDELPLRDVQFAYCRNCRTCWDPSASGPMENCTIDDDLTSWIKRIAAADGLILRMYSRAFLPTALVFACSPAQADRNSDSFPRKDLTKLWTSARL